MRRFIPFLLLPLSAGHAQEPGLQGPTSGLVFHAPSQAIRLIHGVPGASYLGPAVLSGISRAGLAPDGRMAVVRGGESWYLVNGLKTEDPIWTRIETASSDFDVIAWSSTGKAAALLDNGARQILILYPHDATQAQLAVEDLPAPITSLAVEDGAGALYACAADEENGGGIYRGTSGEAWTLLMPVSEPCALALSPKADRLFTVGMNTGHIHEFRNYAQDSPATLLVLSAGAPEPAAALRVSRDGQRLLVARGSKQPRIDVFDLVAGDFGEAIELDSKPEGITHLAGGPHLLLSPKTQAGEPLVILTEGPAGFRAFFVPVGE